MKVCYSELKCPHCGSGDYNILKGDVFLCEYCGEKFSFDIEEIDFSSENKCFIEELKEQFKQKVYVLHKEIVENRVELNKYLKLANPKKFFYLSIICFILSFCFMFTAIIASVIGYLISTLLFVLSRKNIRAKNKEYNPKVNYYASKIVELYDQIDFYTKLLSKLTR